MAVAPTAVDRRSHMNTSLTPVRHYSLSYMMRTDAEVGVDNRQIENNLLIQEHSSIRFLNLVINPTEKCNFRCVYCPEKFLLGRMKPEVVDGVKNLIYNRSDDLRKLGISWFGGEPTLAMGVVLDIMQHANRICSAKDITLCSGMTTNAYKLNTYNLKVLVTAGVTDYQISFDGEEEEHDRLRIRADGAGTFNAIWGSIVGAHSSDIPFTITIRVHVNRNNHESIKRLLRRISETIGSDSRFCMFIRPLSKLGGPNDQSLEIIEDNLPVDELRAYATSVGLKLKGEETAPICYASKLNSFVIRSNGDVGKCTVALYDDRNLVGRLLPDGTMNLDVRKMLWWTRGLLSRNKKELECPWIED